jgi:hypothetical protein
LGVLFEILDWAFEDDSEFYSTAVNTLTRVVDHDDLYELKITVPGIDGSTISQDA